MKKFIISLICLGFVGAFPAAATAETVKVNSGLKIPLRVEQKQSSKNLTAGSKISLEVANDVYQDNVLVFKKGDKAYLNIAEVKKAGFLGHAGEFSVNDGEVYDVNGSIHPINFVQNYSGEEKTYPKVLLTVSVFFLFPLALFGFVKGGQAEITPVQTINTRLDETFDL